MLNALRRGAKTIFAKILIGVLILSFAVWGISSFVNQINPTEVARVGDTQVPASEFARVYERMVNQTSQRMGQPLTPQMAQAIGLPSQVLSQLVTEALQVDAAHDLGVDLSDEALADRITNDPNFAGSNGSFDRLLFNRILANNRYQEDEFIELQRKAAAQEMLVNGLLGGLKSPTAYLEAANRFQNQTRRITYFELTDEALGPIEDPAEEALRAYYDEHKSDFMAPEYRSFSTVTLSPEALADPQTVSADAVQRAYDVEGAFGSPERRHVQQIILDDEAVAQNAAEEISGGADFETVLGELDREFADVDLGVVERSDLVDPAVAEAAFSLPVGGAAAIDGRFGPVLVHVSEIQPAGKRPLSEVEAEIRQDLAVEEAVDEVRGLYNSVEDAVAGGARVDELAERFSLPTRTVENVDAEGNTPDGLALDPPVNATVVSTAFSEEEGEDPEPADLGENVYVWVQLESITPAAERPFEDVAGDVLVAWTAEEKRTRLETLAQEALAAVDEGTPVEEVAARYGVESLVSEPFSRSQPPQDIAQAAAEAAFEGPEGHTADVGADAGSRVILKVTEVSEPAFFEADANLQTTKQALDQGLADTLLYEFVNARQSEVGATVNQPVLNQIIGLGDGRS